MIKIRKREKKNQNKEGKYSKLDKAYFTTHWFLINIFKLISKRMYRHVFTFLYNI